MSHSDHGNPACPYLGLEDDADTSLAFPSVWNTCHRTRRIAAPSLQHQAEHCLSENHRTCVVFPGEQATLPPHLRAAHSRAIKTRQKPYQGFAFLFVGIVAALGLGWAFLNSSYLLPTVRETPSPGRTALLAPAVTGTDIATSTPFPTMTIMPHFTSTGEVVSKHQLEQPIGSDYQFVIHRIVYGENLNQCAAKYHTSIEAIMLVTYDLKTPVWVGTLIVIPVGFTDVLHLPAFEPYEVTREGTSLKVLALGFGVSLEDMKYYNAIGTDESLQIGDWLLIPHARLVP